MHIYNIFFSIFSGGDIEETGTTEGDFSRLLTFGRKERSDSNKHYVAGSYLYITTFKFQFDETHLLLT